MFTRLSIVSLTIALIIGLFSLAPNTVKGQVAQTGAGLGKPTPAGSYQGPGDVSPTVGTIYGFWSTEAYSSAKRGTKAVNACLPNGGTCADFSTDASTGKLDVTTISGSSCTATISSGTYVTATGATVLTLAAGIGIVSTNNFAINGLTGTGSFASLTGVWQATTGSTGTVLNFTGPTGLGTVTITSGTVSGCTGAKWYDQSGQTNCGASPGATVCDGLQATLAMQPVLVVNALNGTACWGGNGTAGMGFQTLPNVSGLGGTPISLPLTITGVAERTGNFTTSARIVANNVNPPYLDFSSTTNDAGMSASTQIVGTASNNAFHALIAAMDLSANADSVLVTDGSVVGGPGSTGTTTWASTISLMTNPSTNNSNIYGYECEASIYSTLQSSTQYGNLTTNIRSSGRWNF